MSQLTVEHDHLEELDKLSPDEQKAAQLLQEIYDKWSYITFDEDEEELHGPASKKEVDYALERLEKVSVLPLQNEELVNWYESLNTVANESQNRRFIGSWWIIGGVSLFLLVAIYSFGISEMTKDFTVAEAQRRLDGEISYLTQQVNRLSAIENRTEIQEGALQNQQEQLDELKPLTAEGYRDLRLSQSFWRGFRFTMRQIPMILFVVAYYFASKAPEYLINRREREMQLMMKGAGVMKKAILGLMGFFLATPWVTYYDVHADGRKTYSDSNMEMGILQLVWKFGVPVLIAVFVMYTMMVILPFLTVINYLRNYQADKIDGYVDKLKGVFIKPQMA